MRLPRVRLTIRQMMAVVAAVGAFLWALPILQERLTAWLIRRAESVHDKDTTAHYSLAWRIGAIQGGKASVGPLVEALTSRDEGIRFAATFVAITRKL